MDGLLIVDKPSGPTSHDVVARMRRVLREKRIGHTGTLDPLASGVMLLVVGKATRLAKFLSAADKSYDAVVRFGFATDTADSQGQPLGPIGERPTPSREAIEAALDAFRGTFLQQPPAFSAKKIDGQRSYKLARNARLKPSRHATEPPAPFAPSDLFAPPSIPASPAVPAVSALPPLPALASVTAHAIRVVSVDGDRVTLSVHCSAGFYIRSLAHDLGEGLGVGAHLTALRRTRTGDFGLDRSITLDASERDPAGAEAALIPMAAMLPALPSVVLTAEGLNRVSHGQDIRLEDQHVSSLKSQQPSAFDPRLFVRLTNHGGDLMAIAERTAAGLLHPSVVLM